MLQIDSARKRASQFKQALSVLMEIIWANRVSRFKEKRRIDSAIAHKNMEELKWALQYAKSRLDLSTMKEHEKHWKKTISQVQQAMVVE